MVLSYSNSNNINVYPSLAKTIRHVPARLKKQVVVDTQCRLLCKVFKCTGRAAKCFKLGP